MANKGAHQKNPDEKASTVPLPIQTFFWRQTSPFIRQKLGKLHEAACLQEIKEACKSFEKVLVQNILFGLSPSLTEAIKEIPRWKFVEAAFPHVMHCAAQTLISRRENRVQNLGQAETKLLYTLHWIILDAIEECADADREKDPATVEKRGPFFYLFPLHCIQLFVYLFAPLCEHLRESDFQSFRLENGLKVWQAMWDYRHPDAVCFTTPVKRKLESGLGISSHESASSAKAASSGVTRLVLPPPRMHASPSGTDSVFLGLESTIFPRPGTAAGGRDSAASSTGLHTPAPPSSKPSTSEAPAIDKLDLDGSACEADEDPDKTPTAETVDATMPPAALEVTPDSSRPLTTPSPPLSTSGGPSPNNGTPFGENLANAFNFRRIDSIDNSTAEDRTSYEDLNKDSSWLVSPRTSSFPETIPEETSSTEDEHVMIFKLDESLDRDTTGSDSTIYKADSSVVRAPLVQMNDICRFSTTTEPTSMTENNRNSLYRKFSADLGLPKSSSPVDKEFVQRKLDSALKAQVSRPSNSHEVSSATYMDVAVLRCLFLPLWVESGVFWGLQFMHQRLQEIHDEKCCASGGLKRSNSLPMPGCAKTPEGKLGRKEIATIFNTNLIGTSLKEIGKIGDPQSARPSTSEDFVKQTTIMTRRRRRGSAKEIGSLKENEKQMGKYDLQVSSLSTRSVSENSLESLDKEGSWDCIIQKIKDMEMSSKIGSSILARIFDRDSNGQSSSSKEKAPTGPFGCVGKLVKGKSLPSLIINGASIIDHSKTKEQKVLDLLPPATEEKAKAGFNQSMNYPTITVTEYISSPENSSSLRANRDENEKANADQAQSRYRLVRSKSDLCIRYNNVETPEAPGAAAYITSQGEIDLTVVLNAVHSVTARESACSLRVCEVLLNLVEILLNLGIGKSNPGAFQASPDGTNGHTTKTKAGKMAPLAIHNTFLDCVVRILTHLGCPHGCGEGLRGPPADMLRSQAGTLLGRLQKHQPAPTHTFFVRFVSRADLAEVLDFFHAFVGFCLEPGSLLSPLGPKRSKQGSEYGNLCAFFGTVSVSNMKPKTIEGIIIMSTFKIMTSRLVRAQKDLKNSDNMALFCDVRQLMQYVKDAHGAAFRKTALSCLLDSAEFKKPHQVHTHRIVRRAESFDGGEAARQKADTNQQNEGETSQQATFYLADETTSVHNLPSGQQQQHWDGGAEDQQGASAAVSPSAVSTARKNIFKKKAALRAGESSKGVHGDVEDEEPLFSGQQKPGKIVKSAQLREQRSSGDLSVDMSRSGSKVKMTTRLSGIFRSNKKNDGSKGGQVDSSPEDIDRLSPDIDRGLVSGLSAGIKASRARYKGPSGQTGNRFLQAKKKVEDKLTKFGFGKTRRNELSLEDTPDASRRSSWDWDAADRDSEIVLMRERKIVPIPKIKAGLMRFSFLLDTTQPGCIPDPSLLAAVLDLPGAPVISRAVFLLECAYFVNRCNRGQWPHWMKLNLPLYRPSGPLAKRGQPSGMRRTQMLQRAAGKLFYCWAEALGNRLDEILEEELASGSLSELDDDLFQADGAMAAGANTPSGIEAARAGGNLSDAQKRQLRDEDDEEDFLDECSVNPAGNSCPHALKLVACVLLLEVTSFLRETYQYIPVLGHPGSTRSKDRVSGVGGPSMSGWEKHHGSAGPGSTAAMAAASHRHGPGGERRWSGALSKAGYAHSSAQSLHSIGVDSHAGERKISFLVQEVADGESVGDSSTTLTNQSVAGGDGDGNGSQCDVRRKISVPTRPSSFLIRRGHSGSGFGGGSVRRRSIKLKHRQRKDSSDGAELKPSDSMRFRRKVSTMSSKSDVSDDHEIQSGVFGGGDESPGALSDDQNAESTPSDVEADDAMFMRHFPWIKIASQITNYYDFNCPHIGFCYPKCYLRQMRSCHRMLKAMRKVHGEDDDDGEDFVPFGWGDIGGIGGKQGSKGGNKQHSGESQVLPSPLRRKDSWKNFKSKIDSSEDGSHVGSRTASTSALARDLLTSASDQDRSRLLGHGDGSKPVKGKFAAKEQKKPKEEAAVLRYIRIQVGSLFQVPLSVICKASIVIASSELAASLSPAWYLLLEGDSRLAAAAAATVILAAVKAPSAATRLVTEELRNDDAVVRIQAILRFQVLWRNRYQVWSQMEDGAHLTYKPPPHGIEFTLPSPKLGAEAPDVADPPWMPPSKAKVEEVALNQQDQHAAFVTATKTRKKQQKELVRDALAAEHEKLRTERENFRLHSVPVGQKAAYEPSLFHAAAEDHEEAEDDGPDANPRSATHQHMAVAQSLFPSCLCIAADLIISLLDDAAVTLDGTAVYEVAQKVVWSCLVEDSTLFLRHFLERLTRENQDAAFQSLRKLARFMGEMPPQAAFSLYNYMIGYVMFILRTPSLENGQELLSNALSVLWMVAPYCQNLFFKDLKQVLRKEQCDTTLLIMANVPSAKRILVHGLEPGGIPCQFPIQEDTQFVQILQESFDFFNIDEQRQDEYFLVDQRSGQIHNLTSYVRDFYFFKRSQYPELSLVRMKPFEAYERIQQQAFILRATEIGKLMMALSILGIKAQSTQRAFLLHEELMRLPSFPRRALEADFGLYNGILGKDLYGLDVHHKLLWVQVINGIFDALAGTLHCSTEIHLFLNVVKGALILHSQNAAMIRHCLATFLNASIHFKHIFNSNGFLLIMPTILRQYSSNMTNYELRESIEFTVKQFYILHRKPFILQMFGAAAPILDRNRSDDLYGDANKIEAKALFSLLCSLSNATADPLDILSVVTSTMERPLRSLDFCYSGEPPTISLLECVALAVTVVAYAPDSRRATQMLIVLESMLPFVLKQIQRSGGKKTIKAERDDIHNLSASIHTLVVNCEPLAKDFRGPQKPSDNKGSSVKALSRAGKSSVEIDEDSQRVTDFPSRRMTSTYDRDFEDSEGMRAEFRTPRDTLLSLVAEYLTTCSSRLAELAKKAGPDMKPVELLDKKCHARLAEVAHSLLKVSSYDPETMACRGLRRYMNEILPAGAWALEALRPSLLMILRRLDKMADKIFKKPSIRHNTDWDAAAALMRGVYTTLCKHPYVSHYTNVKLLVQCSQSLVLGELPLTTGSEQHNSVSASLNNAPPPAFCSVVVRITAMQILALGDIYTLEQVCGGSSTFPNPDRTERILLQLILPLCLRVGSGRKDSPGMKQQNVVFAFTVLLHAMNPPIHHSSSTMMNPQQQASGPPSGLQHQMSGKSASMEWSGARASSFSARGPDSATNASKPTPRDSIYEIVFLGLKILIVCFERQVASQWVTIAKNIREVLERGEGGVHIWNFIDFIVTRRSPLYMMLLPAIHHAIQKATHSSENGNKAAVARIVKDRISGLHPPAPASKATMLNILADELQALRLKLAEQRSAGYDMGSSSGRRGSRPSIYPGTPSASGPQRSSFTEFVSGEHSVTRLGNPVSSKKISLPLIGLGPSHRSERPGHEGVWRFKATNMSEKQKSGRRTSYSGEPVPGGLEMSPKMGSETRLYRKSTFILRRSSTRRASARSYASADGSRRRRFAGEASGGGSREFSGTPSMESMSSQSGTPDDGTGDQSPPVKNKFRHRLHRSRKVLQLRSRRGGNIQVSHIDLEPAELPPTHVTGAKPSASEDIQELSVQGIATKTTPASSDSQAGGSSSLPSSKSNIASSSGSGSAQGSTSTLATRQHGEHPPIQHHVTFEDDEDDFEDADDGRGEGDGQGLLEPSRSRPVTRRRMNIQRSRSPRSHTVFDFQQKLEDVAENSDSGNIKEKHLSWPTNIDEGASGGLDDPSKRFLRPCLSPRYFPTPMSPLALAEGARAFTFVKSPSSPRTVQVTASKEASARMGGPAGGRQQEGLSAGPSVLAALSKSPEHVLRALEGQQWPGSGSGSGNESDGRPEGRNDEDTLL